MWRTFAAMLLALIPMTVLAVPETVLAAQLPPVGQVAYQYSRGSDCSADGGCATSTTGIGIVGLVGGDARDLTVPPEGWSDHKPAFSPDGQVVAYDRVPESAAINEEVQLRLVGSDGTRDRLVASAARDAAFSPDGRYLSYVSYADDIFTLVVARLKDGQVFDRRVVATSEHSLLRLEWSPLGDRIAYYRDQLSPTATPAHDQMSLFTVGLDDRPPRLLSGDLRLQPTRISWAPNGSTIAVLGAASDGELGHWYPWLVADGQAPRPLLDPNDTADTVFYGVRWAPHGLSLVVTPNNSYALWIVSPDGQLTHGLQVPARYSDEVEFSADGTALVLATQADDGLSDLYLAPVAAPTAGWTLTDTGHAVPDTARAVSPGLTSRLAGLDRIGTAIVQAETVFDSANEVVIATAADYADGLVAAPLAVHRNAPLLLTRPDRLDARVADTLRLLSVEKAVLMGGTAALSSQVERDLHAIGIADVQRLEAAHRFALADRVADHLPDTRTAYLVEGAHTDPSRGWPDAVAVSSLAAHTGHPILLTRQSALPASTRSALTRLEVTRAVIVGGTAAVSDDVAAQVRSLGIQVDRLSGADRFETSTAVADAAEASGLNAAAPVAVTGRAWPDALTAGASAATQQRVVILVDGTHAGADTASRRWLQQRREHLQGIRLVGGPTAITPPVAVDIEQVAAGTK